MTSLALNNPKPRLDQTAYALAAQESARSLLSNLASFEAQQDIVLRSHYLIEANGNAADLADYVALLATFGSLWTCVDYIDGAIEQQSLFSRFRNQALLLAAPKTELMA